MHRKLIIVAIILITFILMAGIWFLQLKNTTASWHIKETERAAFKKLKKDVSEIKNDYSKRTEKMPYASSTNL